jgi:hypothetical protein
MSKRVKKHCSILNYIRRADLELYELVQDLCIGRMLVPRRNTSGLTFLRPDKKLMSNIMAMASGDDPEKAVAALQSLVLMDHLSSADEFAANSSNIPTFLNKKLPFDKVDGNKVILTNGAELTLDREFEHRNDRSNMSVWVISKALVPSDTADVDSTKAKTKPAKKTGGGDITGTRGVLFMKILKRHSNADHMSVGNPAMEILCSLCDHLTGESKKAVQSQLSWDTLGSLAIVLKPFKGNDQTYISTTDYNSWVAKNNNSAVADLFYHHMNVIERYQQHMEKGAAVFASVADVINKARTTASSTSSKPTIISNITIAFNKIATGCKDICSLRENVIKNKIAAFAEAELRVLSALLHDSALGCIDYNEARSLYETKCNLSIPYIVTQKEHIINSNLAFYYSSAYLIARSDGMVYYPGCVMDGDLDSIANESSTISLDGSFKKKVTSLQSKYNERSNQFKTMMTAWAAENAPLDPQ